MGFSPKRLCPFRKWQEPATFRLGTFVLSPGCSCCASSTFDAQAEHLEVVLAGPCPRCTADAGAEPCRTRPSRLVVAVVRHAGEIQVMQIPPHLVILVHALELVQRRHTEMSECVCRSPDSSFSFRPP